VRQTVADTPVADTRDDRSEHLLSSAGTIDGNTRTGADA
jgi:hypothetical protein